MLTISVPIFAVVTNYTSQCLWVYLWIDTLQGIEEYLWQNTLRDTLPASHRCVILSSNAWGTLYSPGSDRRLHIACSILSSLMNDLIVQ